MPHGVKGMAELGAPAPTVTRMEGAFPGLGTVINVATIVVGSLMGMAVGHRLPERTRSVVTDCLGLTTLLLAGPVAAKVADAFLAPAAGSGRPAPIPRRRLHHRGIRGSPRPPHGLSHALCGLAPARALDPSSRARAFETSVTEREPFRQASLRSASLSGERRAGARAFQGSIGTEREPLRKTS